VKETDVFIARTGDAADSDLIDHVHVPLGFTAGAADVKRRSHTALQNVNERKTLTHIDVFQMRRMGAFAGWPAVRKIIGSKKIGFGRIVKNIVAGVDTGVKMRVDEAGRN